MKSYPAYLLVVLGLLLFSPFLFAQQASVSQADNVPKKFALVIGNAAYSGGLVQLANPVNDANDVAAALNSLGFTVDKVLNGNLQQMEDASIRLKDRLSEDENAYGFFFYAGHGVQSGGENYLIPVNASIPGENQLRNRALSMQGVLDDLNDARNALNVVVLDACRDNPFGWSRGGSRGLSIVTRQPADSIIVYATSAGQTASDGDGRNGLFTSQLLANLATPGLEVIEVFRRTGAEVAQASGNKQVPAVYSQFFGTAYLAGQNVDFEGNMIITTRPLIIGGAIKEPEPAKYWSVGLSVGSSFMAPYLIGTVHGTIAPFNYSFLELGFDYGFLSESFDGSYYSMYPFAHYAFYWPFTDKIGAYAGLGAGYYMVSYKFDGGDDFSENYFTVAFTAGAILFDMIKASYVLKTNFSGIMHKVSVGYSYRFK